MNIVMPDSIRHPLSFERRWILDHLARCAVQNDGDSATIANTLNQFAAQVANEVAKWGKVIRSAGTKAE